MSIFHYKAELIQRLPEDVYIYRFFPDSVMAKDVKGTFSVSSITWQSQIIVAADAEEKGLVATDSHCVLALTAKLKKEFEVNGFMAKEVLRVS